MKLSLSAAFARGIGGIVRNLCDAATARVRAAFQREATGAASVDANLSETERTRRSRRFASLFPCLYNANHPHPVGTRHTCNDFLIKPRRRRTGGTRLSRPASRLLLTPLSSSSNGRAAA